MNLVLNFLLACSIDSGFLFCFGITSGFYRHPRGGLCIFFMGSCYFDLLLVLLHEIGCVSSFLTILFHIKHPICFIMIMKSFRFWNIRAFFLFLKKIYLEIPLLKEKYGWLLNFVSNKMN